MKNFLKIFVVVAGIAAALYACEAKKDDTQGSAPDSLTQPETTAPDTVETSDDTTAAVEGDTTK